VISDLNDVPSIRSYLVRIGAESRSIRTAVVKEVSGKYWKDICTIRFGKDGSVDCKDVRYMPTDLESAAIKTQCANLQWPEHVSVDQIIDPPQQVKDVGEENIFEFRDEHGRIIMLQTRHEGPEGKRYVPWTFWSDGQWRCAEPEGNLPLYNGHRISGSATVFIHEGAKAARKIQRMVDGVSRADREALAKHPWADHLVGAIHVGWIGGALSPHRTDWSPIRKNGIDRAYIVADNDAPGLEAAPAISHELNIPTFLIQFTKEFGPGFDLGDDFPEKMFGGSERQYYIGPSFRSCQHPATWATDLMPNGKGRPLTVLRPAFKGLWAYVEETDQFVCTAMPEIVRSADVLNKMAAAFSHTDNTARLITKNFMGRVAKLCYRPDLPSAVVTFKETSAINLHVASTIRAAPGDVAPWERFLKYMFPSARECKEVKRWVATLIARPEIRMGYSLLLVSESQGIGKTTLGSAILAPLVGEHNVAYPSENDIGSAFNSWVANKRLAIINEIYSGSSWRAYNSLKSLITDKEIEVNKKYTPQYTAENWCHFLACSNSMRALKMEGDDRRWFYPEVTEVPMSKAEFGKFREWIEQGGLSIIRHWADNFGNYVMPADRAPMTERKREMIEGSRSEAQGEAAAIASMVLDRDGPCGVAMKDVFAWCRSQSPNRMFDSEYELRKTMKDAGLLVWRERIRIHGHLQHVMVNPKLFDAASREEENAGAMLRSKIVRCQDISSSEM